MSYTKHSTATLNLAALTHFGHLFQISTKQSNKGFRLSGLPEATDTHHNTTKTVTFHKRFQRKHVTYCCLLGCCFTLFSTKRQTKKTCHYIPNIIQYYMTLKLTSDIQLQLGFPQN